MSKTRYLDGSASLQVADSRALIKALMHIWGPTHLRQIVTAIAGKAELREFNAEWTTNWNMESAFQHVLELAGRIKRFGDLMDAACEYPTFDQSVLTTLVQQDVVLPVVECPMGDYRDVDCQRILPEPLGQIHNAIVTAFQNTHALKAFVEPNFPLDAALVDWTQPLMTVVARLARVCIKAQHLATFLYLAFKHTDSGSLLYAHGWLCASQFATRA